MGVLLKMTLVAFSVAGFFALLKIFGIEFTGLLGQFGVQMGIGIALALYFLPAMIASNRRHKNASPIFILNLFFGWTLIGWVGCLAWGCSHQEARP